MLLLRLENRDPVLCAGVPKQDGDANEPKQQRVESEPKISTRAGDVRYLEVEMSVSWKHNMLRMFWANKSINTN